MERRYLSVRFMWMEYDWSLCHWVKMRQSVSVLVSCMRHCLCLFLCMVVRQWYTLAHSSCKQLSFIRDLIILTTLLPIPSFPQHSALSVLNSSNKNSQDMLHLPLLLALICFQFQAPSYAYINKTLYIEEVMQSLFFPSYENLTPVLPSFVIPFMYTLKSQGNMTHSCLT